MTGSYPADGTGGLTITDWSDFFNSRDGADECYTADAITLTRIDSGSICQLSPGSVSINGYRMFWTSSESLTCPTPASGTATYYIVAYYDPNLNVANSDDSAPRPLGPCRLGLYADTDINAALSGKSWILLYQITRSAGQTLNNAVATPHVKFLGGPTVDWPNSMPTPPTGSTLMPRGTVRFATDVRKFFVRTVTAGVIGWMDILNDGPYPFPAPSALVANSGAPQFFVYAGVMVKCRGTLKRSSGTLSSGSNDVTLGTFPAGYRPAYTERFIVKTGAGKNYIEVRVNPDGTVVMTGETGVDWIDISPINFRREQ